MLFNDFSLRAPETPQLVRGGVILRAPQLSDHAEWAALRMASRAHLTAWEPDWTDEEVGEAHFRKRVKAGWRAFGRAQGAPFLVFERDSGLMVGGATLSNVRRGAARSGVLGYWIGEAHTRRGHATSAVSALLEYAFGPFGLHRVEAACQPENEVSKHLLAHLGFEQEGYARQYLFINGCWRDHLLYARLAPDDAVDVAETPLELAETSR